MKSVTNRVRALGCVVVMMSLAGSAFAQQVPKAELSAGWQILRPTAEGSSASDTFTKGWYLDVVGNVNRVVGIVGEVGGDYKTFTFGRESIDISFHQFMAGIRLSARTGNVTPFVQVLGGGLRGSQRAFGESESETKGAVLIGGGVNVMANDRFGVRASVDYGRVFVEDGFNFVRAGLGAVIAFP